MMLPFQQVLPLFLWLVVKRQSLGKAYITLWPHFCSEQNFSDKIMISFHNSIPLIVTGEHYGMSQR